MKAATLTIAAGTLLAVAPVFAQDASGTVEEAVVATVEASEPVEVETVAEAVQPVERLLPPNTQLQLASDSEISSKKVELGDKFTFSVVADVVENGVVVIPRDSKAVGEITWKTGRAVGGKSGKFEVSFQTISIRGTDYAMSGTHRQEGKGNTVAAIFATWLISGRSAVMTVGQTVTAFTGEPIPY